MYSVGVRIVTLHDTAPRSRSISLRRRHRRRVVDDLDVSPSVVCTRYSTFGAVAIEREVVLALEPLADDLHVQQPEEAAAEAEAERAATSRARR